MVAGIKRTDINEEELCVDYLSGMRNTDISRKYKCSPSTIDRILKENKIAKIKQSYKTKYAFNVNYFDNIDTEEKAYWIGFIWCDSYVSKRQKNNSYEYAFKLDLASGDMAHIEKLKQHLESNHPIKIYKNGKGSYANGTDIARLHISVKSFGENLYYNYGLIPNRTDVGKLKEAIPKTLMKHFIRGVVDADGSFAYYIDHKSNQKKMVLNITTYEELAVWINEHLYDDKICGSILKLGKRHKEADANCVALRFSGRTQVRKILNYLYGDATVYLDRKLIKYNELLEFDNK